METMGYYKSYFKLFFLLGNVVTAQGHLISLYKLDKR